MMSPAPPNQFFPSAADANSCILWPILTWALRVLALRPMALLRTIHTLASSTFLSSPSMSSAAVRRSMSFLICRSLSSSSISLWASSCAWCILLWYLVGQDILGINVLALSSPTQVLGLCELHVLSAGPRTHPSDLRRGFASPCFPLSPGQASVSSPPASTPQNHLGPSFRKWGPNASSPPPWGAHQRKPRLHPSLTSWAPPHCFLHVPCPGSWPKTPFWTDNCVR